MKLEPQLLPISRPASDFIVEHLADEVLVYDQVHHVAHCLTRSAALVWARCDGKTSMDGAQADLRASGSEEAIEGILAQLVAARLVAAAPAQQTASRPRRQVNRSRRALFSKGAVVAGAVLASPVIFSLVAPSVAQASSACGTLGNPCCTPGNTCTVGICIAGTCS